MSFSRFSTPSPLYRLSRYENPTTLTEWRYLCKSEPGRWADPERHYRVLYTADSEVGSYVEVLQDLRPSSSAVALVDSILDDGNFGDVFPTMQNAANERLRQYYFSTLLPDVAEFVVDLAASQSRTEIEQKLAADLKGRRVKIGDFNAGDYTFTQSVSRLVYTAISTEGQQYVGLANASAEHDGTDCLTFFETGHETEELRGRLTPRAVRPAAEEAAFAREAIDYLAR